MIGIRTTGNATLIAYDGKPILVTDPWLGEEDAAYFGSWNLAYKISEDIKNDIQSAEYVWFSHGHPDHLNPSSYKKFIGKSILLPDHVGGRICTGLREAGFQVSVLPDRKWIEMSSNIKIFCITTIIQDAVLLLDINGKLFVNLNDAGTRGCVTTIRKIVKQYKDSYLLTLSGYGDADMINFYDENGSFIEPLAANNKLVGNQLSLVARSIGTNNVIPFSSFHQYQRTDSEWARKYVTPLEAYKSGFDFNKLNYIEPFVLLDCRSGENYSENPEKTDLPVFGPKVFGDCWSEELINGDLNLIDSYFRRKDLVKKFLSFINFRVGGKDNIIKLDGTRGKGITFEVPRASLMLAINEEIFDDLLIGNFMKTTLHNMRDLYEGDFTICVAKYGDNGRAQSSEEIREYQRLYYKRIGINRFYEAFLDSVAGVSKRVLPKNRESIWFLRAKKAYHFLK